MDSYCVPKKRVDCLYEIKKSKFIVSVGYANNVAQAKDFISKVKHENPKANHHCWAYIAAKPGDFINRGCSDDGEPTGTAGKPMLAQLIGSKLGEVVVVITRYFGGIHLGTGGLVKAYSHGVKLGLDKLETLEKTPQVVVEFSLHYNLETLFRSVFYKYKVQLLQLDYTDKVIMKVTLPIKYKEAFKERLNNLSKGDVVIKEI